MLVLTKSLHTISILPLEDLSLILPQPKVGKSLTKSWTEPLSFVSTSQSPQRPRCVKRSLQKSNRNPLKANQYIRSMRPPLNINPKHRRKKTLYLRNFSKVSSQMSLKISATPLFFYACGDHR